MNRREKKLYELNGPILFVSADDGVQMLWSGAWGLTDSHLYRLKTAENEGKSLKGLIGRDWQHELLGRYGKD